MSFPLIEANASTLIKEEPYANIVVSRNESFRTQLRKEHSIYCIQYDFDLHGECVNIPFDCILKFDGGHLYNGKVIFNNTIIEASYRHIFNQITIGGTIDNREVWLSWWKLAYTKEQNDAFLINQVINAIDNCIFYYDIEHDVYVGAGDGGSEETVAFLRKNSLTVVQPTESCTVLRGSSTTGSIVRCWENNFISINGLKLDGANVYQNKYGENGIGVTGNGKVLIENCIIKNCFSNCFDKAANGKLLKNGYPEWGFGGKGIQIEGGTTKTSVTVRNNNILNCYIGLSNNASEQERIIMDGNYIDSCYMSLVILRLNQNIKMNVNIDNTIISNNTGDVGVICFGNASNVFIRNTQVTGEKKVKSVLRGCVSYSNIQLIVNQKCDYLIDAALYRDNPEGKEAKNNYVKIIYSESCDNIINTSDIIPKKNGIKCAEFDGCEFDITMSDSVNKTPIVVPSVNNTSLFNIKYGTSNLKGNMDTINKKR